MPTRSGTPFQNHSNSSATSAVVTLPTGTKAGDLCIIYAAWNATGSWGLTPSGWQILPHSNQTASSPAFIAYYKYLTGSDTNPTINGVGSAAFTVGSFAYTNAYLDPGVSANAIQANTSSATCTAPTVTSTLPNGMLVMIGAVASSAGNRTFSAPTNGLSLWVGASSSGIADKTLTSAGAAGSSAMTISATVTNDGYQIVLADTSDEDASRPVRNPLPHSFKSFNKLTNRANDSGHASSIIEDSNTSFKVNKFPKYTHRYRNIGHEVSSRPNDVHGSLPIRNKFLPYAHRHRNIGNEQVIIIPSNSLFGSWVYTTLGGLTPNVVTNGGMQFVGGATGNSNWSNTAYTGANALQVQTINGGTIVYNSAIPNLQYNVTGVETFILWYYVTDNIPDQIAWEFYAGGSWVHRVYIGTDSFGFSTYNAGSMPTGIVGTWQSVQVTSANLGLSAGQIIYGIGQGVYRAGTGNTSTVIFSDSTSFIAVEDVSAFPRTSYFKKPHRYNKYIGREADGFITPTVFDEADTLPRTNKFKLFQLKQRLIGNDQQVNIVDETSESLPRTNRFKLLKSIYKYIGNDQQVNIVDETSESLPRTNRFNLFRLKQKSIGNDQQVMPPFDEVESLPRTNRFNLFRLKQKAVGREQEPFIAPTIADESESYPTKSKFKLFRLKQKAVGREQETFVAPVSFDESQSYPTKSKFNKFVRYNKLLGNDQSIFVPSNSIFGSWVYDELSGQTIGVAPNGGMHFIGGAVGNENWVATAYTGTHGLQIETNNGGTIAYNSAITGLNYTVTGLETFIAWFYIVDAVPQQIEWEIYSGSWTYRAYVGTDLFGFAGAYNIGPVPSIVGQWASVQFTPADIGLSIGQVISGVGLGVYQTGSISTVVFSDTTSFIAVEEFSNLRAFSKFKNFRKLYKVLYNDADTSTAPIVPADSIFGSWVYTELGGLTPNTTPTGGMQFVGGATGNSNWSNTAYTGTHALQIQTTNGGTIVYDTAITGLNYTVTGLETFILWYYVTDNLPDQIAWEFYANGSWVHRVYIGTDSFGFGTYNAGAIPTGIVGTWQSIQVTSANVGLSAGQVITGVGQGVYRAGTGNTSTVIFSDSLSFVAVEESSSLIRFSIFNRLRRYNKSIGLESDVIVTPSVFDEAESLPRTNRFRLFRPQPKPIGNDQQVMPPFDEADALPRVSKFKFFRLKQKAIGREQEPFVAPPIFDETESLPRVNRFKLLKSIYKYIGNDQQVMPPFDEADALPRVSKFKFFRLKQKAIGREQEPFVAPPIFDEADTLPRKVQFRLLKSIYKYIGNDQHVMITDETSESLPRVSKFNLFRLKQKSIGNDQQVNIVDETSESLPRSNRFKVFKLKQKSVGDDQQVMIVDETSESLPRHIKFKLLKPIYKYIGNDQHNMPPFDEADALPRNIKFKVFIHKFKPTGNDQHNMPPFDEAESLPRVSRFKLFIRKFIGIGNEQHDMIVDETSESLPRVNIFKPWKQKKFTNYFVEDNNAYVVITRIYPVNQQIVMNLIEIAPITQDFTKVAPLT